MTEEEWLASRTPGEMLANLTGTPSERKRRLFVSSCCRQLSQHFKDARSAQMIETSDRFADGQATIEELNEAFD